MNSESSTRTPAKETVARQIWLNYFNNTLLERGVITEDEWRRMKLRIERS